ncbi:MAG: RHS repeat-associated core domain-containing protein, partial [Dissulfurispiraceae bacterium]
NTVAVTDVNQKVVNKYSYSPYGVVEGKFEMQPQPFTYVGQFGVMDEGSGIYYMRARFFDANVKRFISEDPEGLGGGDTNLYAYCLNNPIMFRDPLGLEPTFWGTVGTMWNGVQTAVSGGFQGVTSIATNGPPEAKALLGLAALTTGGPLLAAGGIVAAPPTAAVINSAVLASPVTTVALSYAPQINQAAIAVGDFAQSYYLTGPYSMSPAGKAGGFLTLGVAGYQSIFP